MSCCPICFSRKLVGLEISTLNLKPYRLFAVNVSCNIHTWKRRAWFFRQTFLLQKLWSPKNITEKLFLLSTGSKNKNLFTQSIMSTVGLFKNWNMRAVGKVRSRSTVKRLRGRLLKISCWNLPCAKHPRFQWKKLGREKLRFGRVKIHNHSKVKWKTHLTHPGLRHART